MSPPHEQRVTTLFSSLVSALPLSRIYYFKHMFLNTCDPFPKKITCSNNFNNFKSVSVPRSILYTQYIFSPYGNVMYLFEIFVFVL